MHQSSVIAIICLAFVFRIFGADIPEEAKALEIKLIPVNGKEFNLVIKNGGSKPVTFKCNLPQINKNQFMKFPDAAALQFRDKDGKFISNSGDPFSWFNPSILNSTINQPVFRELGQAPGQVNLDPQSLREIILSPDEILATSIQYDEVIKLVRLRPAFKNSVEFRINIKLLVVLGDTLFTRIPESPWVEFPSK